MHGSETSQVLFRFYSIEINSFEAAWSEWSECLGSCVSSRRRICSEQYGCAGLEYEEKQCSNAGDNCFQPVIDILQKG